MKWDVFRIAMKINLTCYFLNNSLEELLKHKHTHIHTNIEEPKLALLVNSDQDVKKGG